MNHAVVLRGGLLQLQTTLSEASAGTGDIVEPHHPITCTGSLRYEADGRFGCEHCSVPADDVRTQICLDHSIGLLLVELSSEL